MTDPAQIVRDIGGDNRKKNPFENLEKQIQAEYNLSWKHQKPKKDKAEMRLKLLNNQMRNPKDVGDTTMFSIFQTILASLYDDRLEVTFGGREEGDEETAENINALAESDFDEMHKDELDFELDWDTCFFGKGLMEEEEYIRDPENNIFIPAPRVLDPITFLRDPLAVSINGDVFHRGSSRFHGYESPMTRDKMEDNSHIFDNIDFKEISHSSSTMSILADAQQARADAQGLQNNLRNKEEGALGANAQYNITTWYTHYRNEKTGKVSKLKVWLSNDRAKVVGLQIIKKDYWQIVDRSLYPHAHDWDGTSIPDLTEDKQRARAVAQNLGLQAMTADLYPSYIYDSNKITNRKDLSLGFNKFIPADGKNEGIQNAIVPLIKNRPNLQLVDFIMNSLDASAQKATATPELQQGVASQEKRTLGEVNLIASKTDTRYSLSAKIFGWSEKRFWNQWYQLYKDNFKEDIDEKVLRVVGAFGPKWRPLRRDNIVTKNFDPDIKIESRTVSRAKQLEERQALTGYFALALQEPTANRRWGLKKLANLNGLKKDEVERLFPPTIDERIAEDENVPLNEDKLVPIQVADDHNVHLEVHSKANQTKAAMAHIEAHKRALSIKKTNPELFPPDPNSTDFQGTDPNAPQTQLAKPTPTPMPQGITPSQTSNQM